MDIEDWVRRLVDQEGCEANINYDAIEVAIVMLRRRALRAQQGLLACETGQLLAEMIETILDISDDLDEFLDTGDFAVVREALLRARYLSKLQDQIAGPEQVHFLAA